MTAREEEGEDAYGRTGRNNRQSDSARKGLGIIIESIRNCLGEKQKDDKANRKRGCGIMWKKDGSVKYQRSIGVSEWNDGVS